MNELNPTQLKKLQKLSHLNSDGEVVLLETIEESYEELNKKVEEFSISINGKLDNVVNQISSIEIPTPTDHREHMERMMRMIEEPEEITVSLNIV